MESEAWIDALLIAHWPYLAVKKAGSFAKKVRQVAAIWLSMSFPLRRKYAVDPVCGVHASSQPSCMGRNSPEVVGGKT